MEKRQELTIRGDFDELTLSTTYPTDPYEAVNHLQRLANGRGMAGRDSRMIRHALSIPFEDMSFLEVTGDKDWEEYNGTGSPGALRRLILRFPYWQTCDGRVI